MTASRERAREGFTLVELLVGLLLAALLSVGLFSMIAGQQRTTINQLSLVRAQQSLWSAMEHVQREIRRAGFGLTGCAGRLHVWSGGATTVRQTLVIRNGYNLLTAAADSSDSFELTAASDASADEVSVVVVPPWNPAASVIHVDSDANGRIHNGDLVAIYQPGSSGGCVVQQATQDLMAPPLNLNVNPSSPYNPPGAGPPGYWPAGCCGVGAIVTRLGTTLSTRYVAIDKGRDPPQLITWTQPGAADREVVADEIEDLQIAYGCDMNGDGYLDEGTTPAARTVDEWANNVVGDNAPSCTLPLGCVEPLCTPVPVLAVRVTIVARTTSPFVGDVLGRRPGAEDNPGDPPPPAASPDLLATGVGTYGRAALTVTVRPRNLRAH